MSQAISIPIEHPGSYISEELDARGWAQADLAYILGKDTTQLNKLIKGNTDITPDTAIALGDAFDMPAEFFMKLQNEYDLRKAKQVDPGVGKRARLSAFFPIRKMIERGWIEDTDPALLDVQIMRFFNKDTLEQIPFINEGVSVIPHAARKSSYENTTPIQYAWLHRVRKIAENMKECPPYSENKLRENLKTIRAHMLDEDDFKHIPAILQKCGVRFVLVESLPGSKIDGVCTWLVDQPVIGMTLRLNRADNFCFVLRHEIEHVLRGDGKEETFAPVDEDTLQDKDDLPECEEIANREATNFCVPGELLDSFIARKSPFISERDVLSFAARVEINPAVVVGQIQKKTEKWGWLRKYQKNIHEKLMDWEYKDGWGYKPPTGL